MATTLDRLKNQIVTGLGGAIETTPAGAAVVGIELTNDQLDTAIKLAKEWFTARKGFVVYRPLPIQPGKVEYHMAPDVQQVLDVVFSVPSDISAYFTFGFFDLIPYGPQGAGGFGGSPATYSGFAQLLQYNEQRRRMFSAESEWAFDEQMRILRIFSRLGANLALLRVKLNDFDPARLADKDAYIFNSWVRAKAKEIVGRVRSKFDQLPAAGGVTSMDGKDLIAEAKEEFERLDKEIFYSQGPDGFHVG